MSRIGQGIKKSVLTANSMLYAVTASVPAALSMAASRIVARLASGNVVAATVAEILTLIGVAAGADVTGSNPPQAHEGTHVSGGSDDIDSALADAAIPSLATSKITSGQFSLDRMPRGTDTHVLTAKGAGVSPAYEAAAGGDAGEGHIDIEVWNYNAIVQGTWVLTPLASTNYLQGINFGTTTYNNQDEVNYKVSLQAGTYTLQIVYSTSESKGIISVLLDAVEIANIDAYVDPGTRINYHKEANITVAASGLKTLAVKVDGKNGSSSGYTIIIQHITLWRTA